MCRFQSAAVTPAPIPKPSAAALSPGKAPPALHLELARELDGLPNDLAVTLLVVGTFGIVIPGPVPPGVSFILLGTIAFRPTLIAHTGAPLARRFPKLFCVLIGLVRHFRLDLEARYPGSVPALASLNAAPETGPAV